MRLFNAVLTFKLVTAPRLRPSNLLLLLMLSSTYLPLQVMAQENITVNGKVTEANGTPLPGVSIALKGTNRAVVSDAEGNFSIPAPSTGTLTFSYVGYGSKDVRINNQSNLTVTVTPEANSLADVVVVGYGTQRRATVTGAIANVSGKTVAELPVANISQALQGRVAGVQVTNNGSPGTQPIVRIRGIASISFASDPLYVVDGFPTGDLSTIDTRDIESVDVLKDASAAAIYGSRATNGVIMITTKKGRRDGKVQVSLDSYYGIQKVTSRLDLLDTKNLKNMHWLIEEACQVVYYLRKSINQFMLVLHKLTVKPIPTGRMLISEQVL